MSAAATSDLLADEIAAAALEWAGGELAALRHILDRVAASPLLGPACPGGFALGQPGDDARLPGHIDGSRCYHVPGDCRCRRSVSPHSPAFHESASASADLGRLA